MTEVKKSQSSHEPSQSQKLEGVTFESFVVGNPPPAAVRCEAYYCGFEWEYGAAKCRAGTSRVFCGMLNDGETGQPMKALVVCGTPRK